MDNDTATGREWAGLAVLALPTLLVSIDIFVLLLALPRLSQDLHASGTQQLWISDIYGFLLAGFLVTMGTLGDRTGRRRVLLIGAAAFGAASVLAAYSSSPAMLIAARAVLGIAGATLSPSTLALISTMFRQPRQRAVAIGVWMACFMSGAAIGPVAGGLMLEHFWWGSVFLLAVPAMALLLILGPIVLPEYRAPAARRLDLGSVALSLAAILLVAYALTDMARTGWQPLPAAAAVAGIALGSVFVRRQRTLAEPLLDLRLLKNRTFAAAMSGMTLSTMLTGATMLLVTQYFELARGLSPVRAGLCMVPAAVTMTASSLVSPRLARHIRPAYVIAAGLAVAVGGLLLIGRAQALASVSAGWALVTLGSGPMVVLSVDMVIGSVPQAKAGAAAALNETGSQLGFALGIAILGSLSSAVYRARIAVPAQVPARVASASKGSYAGAVAAAHGLPSRIATALLDQSRTAFTGGMHVTATTSAVLLAGVAVTTVIVLRGPAGTDDGLLSADDHHPGDLGAGCDAQVTRDELAAPDLDYLVEATASSGPSH
jgi:DHA2 family multidrug resistance protein-like MFS transporter